MKLFFTFLFLSMSIFASEISEEQLKKMIGHMLIIGFNDSTVNENSEIIKQINKYELGGVILFDVFYNDRTKNKNISSPQQLQNLTASLQSLSKHKLIISVDQEGGRVARLKPEYGFQKFPSAKRISKNSTFKAKKTYKKMSKMLQENGINCNFAPVVDLAVNYENKVIVGLERSFGDEVADVTRYAEILIREQDRRGVLSVLKHFPGHGSSREDSHFGFVNITDTWKKGELEPYKQLINTQSIDMIMTAHVYNSHLDKDYPATLSYKVNTELLRENMGYQEVVISDDLQMKAITKHFTLQQTVILAINAGVDILLFGNQLAEQNTDELIQTIFQEVKSGRIPLERIIESNKRIQRLHE